MTTPELTEEVTPEITEEVTPEAIEEVTPEAIENGRKKRKRISRSSGSVSGVFLLFGGFFGGE